MTARDEGIRFARAAFGGIYLYRNCGEGGGQVLSEACWQRCSVLLCEGG